MEKQLLLAGNEDLVEEYFEHLFCRGEKRILESLRDFCGLEGNCVFDCYIGCNFSAEYLKGEWGYFGENLVRIYYQGIKEDDIEVILNYEEFYTFTERCYMAYAEKHEHCKEEIVRLLKQLKTVFLKESIKLPFQFRTLAFPSGEDCLSIDFDKGYELLTIFLVFEAVNAYPAVHKVLMEMLNQKSNYRKIRLNVCSLEIHPDTTKIMDNLARNGKVCAVATKEILPLVQIWTDKLDIPLESISEEIPEPKNLEGSKWRSFWKRLRNAKTEKENELLESNPQESEMQEAEKKENEKQEVELIIQEAYNNKVCIVENAYMGRTKNGMQIAMFLNDAGEICKAFPVPHDTLS